MDFEEYRKKNENKAETPEEYIKNHPDVEMIGSKVEYSNEKIKKVSLQNLSVSARREANKAMTPYDYLRQGKYQMQITSPQMLIYFEPPSNAVNQIINEKALKEEEFIYDDRKKILYWRNSKKEKEVRLANFEIKIIKKVKLIKENGIQEMLIVRISGESEIEIEIEVTELSNLLKYIESNPEYRLYPDSRQQQGLFKLYVSEEYAKSKKYLATENIYVKAGWENKEGYWHYYSGRDRNCRSKFSLAEQINCKPIELIDWAVGLMEIGNKEIMLPLIVYMHMGYTLKLFEEAGYNEEFIMTLIGASGSKKTSLARVMFCLFGGELINFTSTDRAIELEMMNRQDATLVLDDLSSGNDKNLAGKFEKILRQLGDSTGRKKSINGGREQEKVSTRCAVVLTAETDIDALSKSSKLRTLAVYLNVNSVKSEVLSKYQQDEIESRAKEESTKLEQYMTMYINFLERNFLSIVREIVKDKNQEEKVGFGFARQATIYRMIKSQAKVILSFWNNVYQLTEDELKKVMDNWFETIMEVIKNNEKRGTEVEPYILFLQAISYALTDNTIISPSKQIFSVSTRNIGYKNGDEVILLPDMAYEYVVRYCRERGKIFVESKNAIVNKLNDLRLIEVYEQKDHKPKLYKQQKIKGVVQNVISLKWAIAESLLLKKTEVNVMYNEV